MARRRCRRFPLRPHLASRLPIGHTREREAVPLPPPPQAAFPLVLRRQPRRGQSSSCSRDGRHAPSTSEAPLAMLPLLWLLLLSWAPLAPGSPPAPPQQEATEECSTVRMKCAYRVGCGMALQEYMLRCADIMTGRTQSCSLPCKRALIALTSTEEGKSLMQCRCGDDFCRVSKQRVEVCRPEVSRAVAEGTVVSCAVAQWICTADHLCSAALIYYNRFCGAMFHGRKCTLRCNNSVAILNRQEKAAKLRDCYCDGSENFPCKRIKTNMGRLCFGHEDSLGANPTVRPPPTTTDMDNALAPLTDRSGEQEARQHQRGAAASNARRTFRHSGLTPAALLLLVAVALLTSRT